MKKSAFLLCLIISAYCLYAQSGTIDINGKQYPVDTLEHYTVGPGTDYVRFDVRMGSTLHKLYMLETDLRNPYIKIEENPGQDRLGTTEKLANTQQRIDSAGHRPIGAVNCNFWVVTSQNTGHNEGLLNQPFAGSAKDGMLLTEPDDWNYAYNADGSIVHGDRGFVMIDDAGKAFIRNMTWNGRLIKDSKSYAIRDCNRTRVNAYANEITIFNRYIGVPTRSIPDTAIEVIFEPADGKPWSINDTMTCVVKSINQTGGTQLTGYTGALQGRGKGKTRINKCITAVGDTFQLYLGMYSSTLMPEDTGSGDSITPHIMQMVTGNCLVMANGNLTVRNTNEEYNNRNYPRTMIATNNEGNRLWLLVSETPGNYTAEMCGMLKNSGATWAAGMDGGGSTQLLLHGNVRNKTTEGNPRAVSNGLWVISTAPDDNEATALSSSTKQISLPRYCVSRPLFNVYNQYGVLIKKDFADVTLSCPPEVGYITPDGKFVCLGSGTLTATYGKGRLDIPVVALESSAPAFRLDSVWIDNSHRYCIEVETESEGVKQTLLSSALTWESTDAGICPVDENGYITGVSNGGTWIYGTLNGATDSLYVTVETADQPTLPLADFTSANDNWTPTTTSSVSTISLTPSAEGSTLGFKYKKSRTPLINITPSVSIYGLPEAIEFVVEKRNMPITSLNISINTRNNDTKQYSVPSLPAEETTIRIPLTELLGTDIAVFPINFSGIRIQIDATADEGQYEMVFKQLRAVYSEVDTQVEDIRNKDNTVRKVILDGSIYIIKDNKTYNILGYEIK